MTDFANLDAKGAADGRRRGYLAGVAPGVTFRRAVLADVPALRAMHRASMTALSGAFYTPRQVQAFLASVETVDLDLVADGTVFVAVADGRIAASGAWTTRAPSRASRIEGLVAGSGTGIIRSVFTHPAHARRGLAAAMIERAETEAAMFGGVERLEICATLTGVPLYRRHGYAAIRRIQTTIGDGVDFTSVRMWKPVSQSAPFLVAA